MSVEIIVVCVYLCSNGTKETQWQETVTGANRAAAAKKALRLARMSDSSSRNIVWLTDRLGCLEVT